MARQFSVSLRNARLDTYETHIGVSPRLRIWTGAVPANCAAANSGTELANIAVPSDYLTAASAGSKTLLGSWAAAGLAAGTAGHFRVYDTGGTVCHDQGTVTLTGGGGDMTIDNTSIAVSQVVTVTSFTLNEGNA